jgi:hypothetical protein
MKNLSKRSKTLIGVIGAVVIVIVIGLALGLTGNLPLQGTASGSVIPYNVCLLPGQSYHLLYQDVAAKVKWTVGDSTVVQLSNGNNKGVTVTAQSKTGFITWVSGKSLFGIGGQSEVGVWHLCPDRNSMPAGMTDPYKTDIVGGTWSSSNTAVATVDSNGWVSAYGTTGQTATITVTAPGGAKYSSVVTIGAQSDISWIK